jgi:uncharacterized protein
VARQSHVRPFAPALDRRIDHVYTSTVADDIFDRLAQCTGFDWDAGNAPKLQERHGVTPGECEQVFFREPLLVAPDARHSQHEEGWAALGRTADGRPLVIVFTLRGELIRPLSARDMSRKERRLYGEAENQTDS